MRIIITFVSIGVDVVMGFKCRECGRLFILLGLEVKDFFLDRGAVVRCPYCGCVYLNLEHLMEVHFVAK